MDDQPGVGQRRGGRKLSFDRDEALRQAMLLFWRHGYEGTSLNELTKALGVTPPSIYAAFGDKKRLFLEVVQLYSHQGAASRDLMDRATTARDAVESLLKAAAFAFTGTDTPPGCLIASAAVTGSAQTADVQAELTRMRQETEAYLRRRIVVGIAGGELPPSTNATALAGHTMAVIQGMSTLARDGANRTHLLSIATTALQAWPAKS